MPPNEDGPSNDENNTRLSAPRPRCGKSSRAFVGARWLVAVPAANDACLAEVVGGVPRAPASRWPGIGGCADAADAADLAPASDTIELLGTADPLCEKTLTLHLARLLLHWSMDTHARDGRNKWPRRFGTAMACCSPFRPTPISATFALRYNAAYAAYQSYLMASNEAAMTGRRPYKGLCGNEARGAARRDGGALNNLLAAMARARSS